MSLLVPVRLIRADNFTVVYSNNPQIGSSFYDIRIHFNDVQSASEEEFLIEERSVVVMSPEHARDLTTSGEEVRTKTRPTSHPEGRNAEITYLPGVVPEAFSSPARLIAIWCSPQWVEAPRFGPGEGWQQPACQENRKDAPQYPRSN